MVDGLQRELNNETNSTSSCAIIMPVYSHYEVALRAAQSIVHSTTLSDTRPLIIVDDQSLDFTPDVQAEFESLSPYVSFRRNETNLGFLKSCNRAMTECLDGYDYILLANSDIVCTAGFLDEMIALANTDPRIALVNPVSNCSATLTVDRPLHLDINMFSQKLKQAGFKGDNDVISVVGFCMLARTEVLKKHGLFDEIYGFGYCEETDLHLRLTSNGYRGVICTTAFVHHMGETSFTDRDERLQTNWKTLMSRYKTVFDNNMLYFNTHTVLKEVRHKFHETEYADLDEIDVLCITPTERMCGGMKVVNQVLNALSAAGIRTVSYLQDCKLNPDFEHLFGCITSTDQLKTLKSAPKIIICTWHMTILDAVEIAEDIYCRFGTIPLIGFLLQDFEGNFDGAIVEFFYDTTDARDFGVSVSEFILNSLHDRRELDWVSPNGVNTDVFHPRPSGKPQDKIIISAMLRDDTKRNARGIISAFEQIEADIASGKIALKKPVKIVTFGNAGKFIPERRRSAVEWVHMGEVPEKAVAEAFSDAHIFIDASLYQGFGLPALEALVSGCKVVVSNTEGTEHYRKDCRAFRVTDDDAMRNAVVDAMREVDAGSVDDCSVPRYEYSLFRAQNGFADSFRRLLNEPPIADDMCAHFIRTKVSMYAKLRRQMACPPPPNNPDCPFGTNPEVDLFAEQIAFALVHRAWLRNITLPMVRGMYRAARIASYPLRKLRRVLKAVR